MKATIYHIVLAVICVVGFCMSISEGSAYFWANFVGLFLFGSTSYLLGLWHNPHDNQ